MVGKAQRYFGSGIEAHRNSENPKVAGTLFAQAM